jgi:hypothetical protein
MAFSLDFKLDTVKLATDQGRGVLRSLLRPIERGQKL